MILSGKPRSHWRTTEASSSRSTIGAAVEFLPAVSLAPVRLIDSLCHWTWRTILTLTLVDAVAQMAAMLPVAASFNIGDRAGSILITAMFFLFMVPFAVPCSFSFHALVGKETYLGNHLNVAWMYAAVWKCHRNLPSLINNYLLNRDPIVEGI